MCRDSGKFPIWILWVFHVQGLREISNLDFMHFPFVFLLTLVQSISTHKLCFDRITNNTKAITGLILARGGSKGIPLKNIQRIDGLSLLGIALTAMQQSKIFQTIWVSTDHPLIAEEAAKYNVNVHWRLEKFAADNTTSMESVQEFVKNHPLIENLALIQCTSPFIKPQYLKYAKKRLSWSNCVFAAVRSFKLRWKHNRDSNRIHPINFNLTKRPRRQDWDGELLEAGMFYFTKKKLLQQQIFQDDKCTIVEIAQEHSMEIDKPFDLEMARFIERMKNSVLNLIN
ncbi:unnamed protein product [Diamesa serratosioi]